ncbi:hypothetical protein FlaCF_0025 [Flavobacterium tructae]|jgi:hypothetical protein
MFFSIIFFNSIPQNMTNMEHIETMEIKDNTFARQFETIVPEGLLSVEYSFQEKKIFLTKINSPEGFDNQATIDTLLKGIMEVVSEKKFRIMPIHPKIVLFIKKNPEYKELLPPGIRI